MRKVNENENLPTDVVAAALSNRKIEAIKLLREHRGIGLKEAKEIMDEYMQARRAEIKAANPGDGSGFIKLVSAVLTGLLLYVLYVMFIKQAS